jgi:hypothetical protein
MQSGTRLHRNLHTNHSCSMASTPAPRQAVDRLLPCSERTLTPVQDILVLMQGPVPPLTFLRARMIGAMRMLDGGEQDDKIIAVCADDPAYKHLRDISELPLHRWKEIRSFFLDYKRGQLEEKFGQAKEAVTILPADASCKSPRAVFSIADPFKDAPLTMKRGVFVRCQTDSPFLLFLQPRACKNCCLLRQGFRRMTG